MVGRGLLDLRHPLVDSMLRRRVLLLTVVACEAITITGIVGVPDGSNRGLESLSRPRRRLTLSRLAAGAVLHNVASHTAETLLTRRVHSSATPALLLRRVTHVISACQSLRPPLLLLTLQATQIALLHVCEHAKPTLRRD